MPLFKSEYGGNACKFLSVTSSSSVFFLQVQGPTSAILWDQTQHPGLTGHFSCLRLLYLVIFTSAFHTGICHLYLALLSVTCFRQKYCLYERKEDYVSGNSHIAMADKKVFWAPKITHRWVYLLGIYFYLPNWIALSSNTLLFINTVLYSYLYSEFHEQFGNMFPIN